jgi:hypothetical protein
MLRWRHLTSPSTDDGNASLEFITVGMILLVPIVYLVLTLAQIQAGAFATEGATRQAARVFVQSATISEAKASASRAVEFALADYGIDPSNVDIAITCKPVASRCLTRHGFVTVTVSTRVTLPLVPPVLNLTVPLSVPLSAQATQQVSRFWGAN